MHKISLNHGHFHTLTQKKHKISNNSKRNMNISKKQCKMEQIILVCSINFHSFQVMFTLFVMFILPYHKVNLQFFYNIFEQYVYMYLLSSIIDTRKIDTYQLDIYVYINKYFIRIINMHIIYSIMYINTSCNVYK